MSLEGLDEIAALQKRIAELEECIQRQRGQSNRLCDAMDRLERERDEAREALIRYASHDPECHILTYAKPLECTCGLDQVLPD